MFGIRKLLRQILQRLLALEEAAASAEGNIARNSEQLALRVSELSSAANRHDMVIEDMIESWEELREKQKEELQMLTSALSASAGREQKDAAEREKALLELLMCTHDMLFALQKAAEETGSEVWLRQLTLSERRLAEARLPSGFQVTGTAGVPVNYAVHEVVDVIPTQDPELDQVVAEVYACGYLYLGRILKKAQVSAYRLTDTSSDNIGGGISE